MFSKNKKKPRKFSTILFETVIVFIVVFVLTCMAAPSHPALKSSMRQKACYSNIRLLAGAIEIYNKEHKEFIDEFNEKTLKLLYEGECLRGDIRLYTPRCKYISKGSLKENGGGFIYCEYHGDQENRIPNKIDDDFEYHLTLKDQTRKSISLALPALILSVIFFIQAIIFR